MQKPSPLGQSSHCQLEWAKGAAMVRLPASISTTTAGSSSRFSGVMVISRTPGARWAGRLQRVARRLVNCWGSIQLSRPRSARHPGRCLL